MVRKLPVSHPRQCDKSHLTVTFAIGTTKYSKQRIVNLSPHLNDGTILKKRFEVLSEFKKTEAAFEKEKIFHEPAHYVETGG
jgi:hypothetical protein